MLFKASVDWLEKICTTSNETLIFQVTQEFSLDPDMCTSCATFLSHLQFFVACVLAAISDFDLATATRLFRFFFWNWLEVCSNNLLFLVSLADNASFLLFICDQHLFKPLATSRGLEDLSQILKVNKSSTAIQIKCLSMSVSAHSGRLAKITRTSTGNPALLWVL